MPGRAELDTEEVKAMLAGVRTLLEQIDRPHPQIDIVSACRTCA
jgi:hypothetical protein